MEQLIIENFREQNNELRKCHGQLVSRALLHVRFFNLMHKRYPIVHGKDRKNGNGDYLRDTTLCKIYQKGTCKDGFIWFLCSVQNLINDSAPKYRFCLVDDKNINMKYLGIMDDNALLNFAENVDSFQNLICDNFDVSFSLHKNIMTRSKFCTIL